MVIVNDDLTLTFIDTRSGRHVRTQDKLEHPDHGVKVRFTHDGTRAVTMEAEDGRFRIWDVTTGLTTAPGFRHPPACLQFAITHDDDLIVSSGGDSRVRFWNPHTGAELFDPIELEMPQKTFALAVRGSKLLVSQGYRRHLQTWDISPDEPPKLSPNQFPFSAISENIFLLDSISPDGNTLIVNRRKPSGTTLASGAPESGSASTPQYPSISAWDIPTAQMQWETVATAYETVDITWSIDGTRFLLSDLSGKTEVRNGLDGSRIQSFPVENLAGFRGGADGQTWIGRNAAGGRVYLWEQESGREVIPSVQTDPSLSGFGLSASGRRVSYYASNRTNGLQHLDYGGTRALGYPLPTRVGGRFADLSPDCVTCAWIDPAGSLVVTDRASGDLIAPVTEEQIGIAEARFTGDGRKIVTLTTDKRSMTCRELPDLNLISEMEFAAPGHIGPWAVNADGSSLVFVVDAPGEWGYPGTKQVHVWNPADNTPPAFLFSFDDDYVDAGISPDGSRLFVTLRQGGAVLYRNVAGWEGGRLPGTDNFTHGAFSHDGEWLALVSKQSGVRVYDLTARDWSPRVLAHAEFGEITRIHFSQDDHQLFVTGLQQPPNRIGDVVTRTDRWPPETGLLWDWRNDDIASDRIPLAGCFPRQFSPDGNRFLLASDSGPKILDLTPAVDAVPDWFYTFVEEYCGARFSMNGKIERTPRRPLQARQAWLDDLIGGDIDTPLARWCRWLVADRTQRSISPDADLLLPEHVARLLNHNRSEEIAEAWRLAPFHARVMARMSSLLADRDDPTSRHRAAWLLERAFQADADGPDAWFARAQSWFKEGQLQKALTAIETALQGRDNDWLYHRLHARVLSRLHEPAPAAPAVAAYDRAITFLSNLNDSRDDLDLMSLRCGKIGSLRQLGRLAEIEATQDQLYRIPERAPSLPSRLIDLTGFYNAGLSRNWHGHPDGNLASLRPGVHRLDGVPFDIRGIVQLQCDMMRVDQNLRVLTHQYPRRIEGIPIDQRAESIHFIQASLYGSSVFGPKGIPVVSYIFRYSDGTRHVFDLKLGEHTRDWWIGKPSNSPAFTPEAGLNLVWQAYIPSGNIGLFKTTWINPKPDLRIESLDLVSAMTTPGAFLLAITVE